MDKRIRPYKNRKQAAKRERIIMLASSAFVMAALTMTGIYMKEKTAQEKQDEYSIDLAELETNIEEKYAELVEEIQPSLELAEGNVEENIPFKDIPVIEKTPVSDDALDYMPREDSIVDFEVAEVDSGLVEIPGVTDVLEETPLETPEVLEQTFTFTEEEGLYAPVTGEVLMPFNMERTVYFATLDQYKYNPAMIIKAQAGNEVFACADGQVLELFQNEELGQVMVLDLGNGYQAIYGQLQDVKVGIGDTVTPGQAIANVAEPTKYYSLEGCNLYFGLKKDGVAVNPEEMM